MVPPAILVALHFDRPEWLPFVGGAWGDTVDVRIVALPIAEAQSAAAVGRLVVDEHDVFFRHDFVLAAIAADFEVSVFLG